MPIRFSIESSIIFTEARGILSIADLLEHIAAKERDGILALPEIFDARDVTLDLSINELRRLAEAAASALHGRRPGRTAVVTNSAFLFGLARSYRDLSKGSGSEVEPFYDSATARSWVEEERPASRELTAAAEASQDLASREFSA